MSSFVDSIFVESVVIDIDKLVLPSLPTGTCEVKVCKTNADIRDWWKETMKWGIDLDYHYNQQLQGVGRRTAPIIRSRDVPSIGELVAFMLSMPEVPFMRGVAAMILLQAINALLANLANIVTEQQVVDKTPQQRVLRQQDL